MFRGLGGARMFPIRPSSAPLTVPCVESLDPVCTVEVVALPRVTPFLDGGGKPIILSPLCEVVNTGLSLPVETARGVGGC